MTAIKSFSITRLRQEEAYGFHQMMVKLTATCSNEKVTPLLELYQAEFNNYELAIKPEQKSQLTGKLAELDAQRGVLLEGLTTHAKNMCKHFEEDKATTAQRVYDIIAKYGEISRLPYLEETGSVDNLAQDLNNYNNSNEEIPTEPEEDRPVVQTGDLPPLELIGIKEWLDQLILINNQFKTVFEQRTAEKSTNVAGLSKSTRKLVDNQYLAVVVRINALIEVNGDEEFSEMVAQMNELIDYQISVLNMRATINAKRNAKKKENVDSYDTLSSSTEEG